jgi:hypothetical protein
MLLDDPEAGFRHSNWPDILLGSRLKYGVWKGERHLNSLSIFPTLLEREPLSPFLPCSRAQFGPYSLVTMKFEIMKILHSKLLEFYH